MTLYKYKVSLLVFQECCKNDLMFVKCFEGKNCDVSTKCSIYVLKKNMLALCLLMSTFVFLFTELFSEVR